MLKSTLYTTNGKRDLFSRNFIKTLIHAKPDRKLTKIPTKASCQKTRAVATPPTPESNLANCNMPAPKITGRESQNENLAESLRFKPKNNPPEIVAPEREKPGNKASIWNRPSKKALGIVKKLGA